MIAPICPYCQTASVLVRGDVIYPRRRDLARKHFYKCSSCPDAYVGCHPDTTVALGRLADADLRLAKQKAHLAFDMLWRSRVKAGEQKHRARGDAYQWLASKLGIAVSDCHIGMFDVETCNRAVEICTLAQLELAR